MYSWYIDDNTQQVIAREELTIDFVQKCPIRRR